MEDKVLISQNGHKPNGCIVAAINDVNSNHSDPIKLNNSNGFNSINSKNELNKQKTEYANHANEQHSTDEPPDGGARAWCVMISAFFCNSIIFGIINTFGTIYIELHENLKANNDSEAGSKAGKCTH